jgi:WbqC-like protein family
MKLAIMQPYLFPYIGYFQLIHSVDKFVVYDDVNFINRGWINRNNILANGASCFFTIPLTKSSQNKKIHEIAVALDAKGIDKLLKTIDHCYRRSPYFEPVRKLITSILTSQPSDIASLNRFQIKQLCGYLGITTQIVDSSRVYKNNHLKGEDRILDICISEKATAYFNPIGGTELYDAKRFNDHNIDLRFIKTRFAEYQQGNHPFVPGLSIIDVLMFNSADRVREMLNHYDLI